MSDLSTQDRTRRDDPACVRRDLPLLWIDVRFAASTMKRKPDAGVLAAPGDVESVVDRVEDELHGEAGRYRQALWACIAIALMPFFGAALAWSGLYWLPVRIQWFPFERGYYGLPWLSLYEWIAYLFLAAFFVYGSALISESRSSTHRLSADYRRLAGADPADRETFAHEVVLAKRERTELVLRRSPVFAEYPPLLDAARVDGAAGEGAAGGVTPGAMSGGDDAMPGAATAGEQPLSAQSPVPPGTLALAWPLRYAIALVIGVAGLSLVASRVLRAMPASGQAPTTVALIIVLTFVAAYAVELAVVGLVASRSGVPFAESVGMRRVPGMAMWLALAAATAFGLRVVATAYAGVMMSAGWRLPGWNVNPAKYFPAGFLGSAVLVFIIVIAAPVVEETIFRGVLLPSLAGHVGQGWAIAFSSFVFAFMHLNPFAFFPILLVGISLGVLFVRSRSLWVAILCHAVFNGIGIIALLVLRGSGVV